VDRRFQQPVSDPEVGFAFAHFELDRRPKSDLSLANKKRISLEDNMPLNDALLAEFDQEMASTRKTLERVPDDKLAWKPHPKSGTMGWLASHIATMVGWTTDTIEKESFDMAPPGTPPIAMPVAKSRTELLGWFDNGVAKARAAIAGASDQTLMHSWSLLSGGKPMFTMPRTAVLRTFVMNHIIHHRAQLGVYLRMNDIPVPSIYGPSADEAGF
jgi:uncharacterized damage-inducible protein DinB